jgi:hypothetical protein
MRVPPCGGTRVALCAGGTAVLVGTGKPGHDQVRGSPVLK